MSINNNLYPPIINTYMPSFIRTGACRVYFSLSDFNRFEDVENNVQIVVNDKNTNQSVLNPDLYPAGIKITNLKKDINLNTNMRFYIEIFPNDLKEGTFQLNRFYKVQIRFTSRNVQPFDPSKNKISKWLIENQSAFSEWSSVCLIRGIDSPTITIRGFEDSVKSKEIIFTSNSMQIIGNILFNNEEGEMAEFLDNMTVKVFKKNEDEQLAKSYSIPIQQDILISKSEFNYTVKENIEDGISYVLKITYTTNGGYQESKYYNFKVIQYGADKINAEIIATADDEEGRIKIHVKGLESIKEDFIGKITIRRTSSETDFSEWEDVHNAFLSEPKELDYTWYDYTVKSGVWYKYCVQKRNRRNDRGVIVQTKEPAMVYFENAFLVSGGRQLKLKFDSTIGSFKYNILESKIDTLGSKYPFIRRNGDVKYRQFPITGLITSFCDENGLFTTKDEIYKSSSELYIKYNEENEINEYKDFSYEREFREKVMDFLYENNVKLFKSPTEGNMLVKLMDINFTPNQTLGRMLYSFSAMVYEIDELDIEKYESYNIQKTGSFEAGSIQQTSESLGKNEIIYTSRIDSAKIFKVREPLSNHFFEDFNYTTIEDEWNGNIIGLIDRLNLHNGAIGFTNKIQKLKQLKITFLSKPDLIKEQNGVLEFANGSETETNIVLNGYWITVNGKDILVRANAQYEKENLLFINQNKNNGFRQPIRRELATYEINDLDITSLVLHKRDGSSNDIKVEISYIAENIQTEEQTPLVNKIYYYKKIGQFDNVFVPGHSIIHDLKVKYNDNYYNGYEELIAVNSISIEAPRGTVVTVKDSLDGRYNQHEISDTGFLNLESELTTIDEFYINGIRLTCAPYQENYPELNRNQSDFVEKYPFINDNKYNRIQDHHYVKQYYKYTYINNKIDVDRIYVDELPKDPIKNGVYAQRWENGVNDRNEPVYKYEYWIYYQNNWYLFDAEEEIVLCPIHALVNYYCEVVEGEYEY